MSALIHRPERGSNIRLLEHIWLYTSCAYNEFDETLMSDEDWDQMAKELDERRREWTPYFRLSLPSPDYPVQTTSMGIDWMGNTAAGTTRERLSVLDRDYSSIVSRYNAPWPQKEPAS